MIIHGKLQDLTAATYSSSENHFPYIDCQMISVGPTFAKSFGLRYLDKLLHHGFFRQPPNLYSFCNRVQFLPAGITGLPVVPVPPWYLSNFWEIFATFFVTIAYHFDPIFSISDTDISI